MSSPLGFVQPVPAGHTKDAIQQWRLSRRFTHAELGYAVVPSAHGQDHPWPHCHAAARHLFGSKSCQRQAAATRLQRAAHASAIWCETATLWKPGVMTMASQNSNPSESPAWWPLE